MIRLEDGTRFTVDRQIRDEDEYLAVGETVTVGWTPEKGVVLVE